MKLKTFRLLILIASLNIGGNAAAQVGLNSPGGDLYLGTQRLEFLSQQLQNQVDFNNWFLPATLPQSGYAPEVLLHASQNFQTNQLNRASQFAAWEGNYRWDVHMAQEQLNAQRAVAYNLQLMRGTLVGSTENQLAYSGGGGSGSNSLLEGYDDVSSQIDEIVQSALLWSVDKTQGKYDNNELRSMGINHSQPTRPVGDQNLFYEDFDNLPVTTQIKIDFLNEISELPDNLLVNASLRMPETGHAGSEDFFGLDQNNRDRDLSLMDWIHHLERRLSDSFLVPQSDAKRMNDELHAGVRAPELLMDFERLQNIAESGIPDSSGRLPMRYAQVFDEDYQNDLNQIIEALLDGNFLGAKVFIEILESKMQDWYTGRGISIGPNYNIRRPPDENAPNLESWGHFKKG
jgi:hypothetical protein